MKKFFVVAGTLLLVAIVIAIVVLSNPLRKSEEQIRERILEITPVGMSMEDVTKVIESNEDWEWDGYIDQKNGFPTDETRKVYVGEQSIRVTVGTYTNFFKTYVLVDWGFDKDLKLIDVRVSKQIAGL